MFSGSNNPEVIIDHVHKKIHSNNHFYYMDSIVLASAGTQDYLMTVPNSDVEFHTIFNLNGSAITQFQLFEASDKTGTTAQTILNNNRNSTKTSSLTIHKGVSGGTTDGTQIYNFKSGSAQSASKTESNNRSDDEIILKKNTKYLLRFTSGTADNLCNLKITFYEDDD